MRTRTARSLIALAVAGLVTVGQSFAQQPYYVNRTPLTVHSSPYINRAPVGMPISSSPMVLPSTATPIAAPSSPMPMMIQGSPAPVIYSSTPYQATTPSYVGTPTPIVATPAPVVVNNVPAAISVAQTPMPAAAAPAPTTAMPTVVAGPCGNQEYNMVSCQTLECPAWCQWLIKWGCSKNCGTGCGTKCSVYADYLYLSPRGNQVVFAQTVDGCDDLAAPTGGLGIADIDHQSGFRVGAAFGIDECSSVGVSYLAIDADGEASLAPLPGSVIRALVVLPSTLNCDAGALAADAFHAVELDQVDLDYKRRFWGCPCHGSLSYIAGLRYAHLDQNFDANISILGTTTVFSDIDFNGVGPRLGVEGEYHLKCGMFGYTRSVLNLLVGEFEADFLQVNTFAGQQGAVSFTDDRIVPVLDLELGLGWTNRCGNCRLTAGYYISTWYNVLTTPGFLAAVVDNNFADTSDNLDDMFTLDGFMLRAELRF